jgi:Na+-transporting NADH:ubiquinone oxidoreductase subunit C
MDVNKNSYTFTFAAIMVVVVAAILSFAATSLKPMQDNNVRLEKMQNILSSINIEVSREEAEEAYAKYITEELVLQGSKEVSGVAAFDVEMSKEVVKPAEERNAPLYISTNEKGEKYFIIPLRGKGLWGPIWGYISLEENGSTIYGATFDHKTETPGLGAEIKTPMFTDLFPGKEIFDGNEFKGIMVMKGNASGEHQVNGISGGTITSVGVQDMITNCMQSYTAYLKENSVATQSNVEDNRVATIDQ